jgi:hypothetical protein
MKIFTLLILVVFLISCSENKKKELKIIDKIAYEYVYLAHSIGLHDPDYVDAYFGPDSIKNSAIKDSMSLRSIKLRIVDLIGIIDTLKVEDENNLLLNLRHKFLKNMLSSMNSRINVILGFESKFNDECKNLYGAISPEYSEEFFQNIINDLDAMLPGNGDIKERYQDFKSKFIIPEDKVDTVFRFALNEAKNRTKSFIDLPHYEDFTLEYVRDKSWSGYNWFQGNAFSLVQINLDQPIYIDRAIDLASHEAYPGHHTHHVLMENTFVKDSNWIEFTIYPLFSPMSLISEGSANYGIEVAFPGKEKLNFERDYLYPLAGIDPNLAEIYNKVQELISKLDYAGNNAAKRFLDGEYSDEETIDYLIKYNLMSESRAKQRLAFIKKYRAYVINYNVGLDMVRKFVEANGGTVDDPKKRWLIFQDLITNPYLPNDIIIKEEVL